MAVALPPGTSETMMERAIQAFVEALGSDGVLTSEEDLREFRDPYAYRGSDESAASAAVMPTSVEQVQAIVRIANEHRVPLWTFSQGRNNTYGGAAPRVRGSVLVNLRRMNRVLEIDDDLAYALVEPGVRFFDLYDALQAGGHKLWPSIPDLGWGSVIGNTLEYGRGYTPYGDHSTTACGMEVVLPDGDVLRTGMGAMAGNRSWQAYQRGFGPSPDSLFMQSNYGIVTKMGVWLMPQPEVYLSGWARFQGDEPVEPLIDALRPLLLDGTIRNYPILGQGVGLGGLAIGDETWNLRFALYGRRHLVEANWAIVETALAAIPGVDVGRRIFTGDEREGATEHDDKVQGGVPGLELMDLFLIPFGESTGHLDLSPLGPLTGPDVTRAIGLMRSFYARHGRPYIAGLLIQPRSVLHISTSFFDTKDEQQTGQAYAEYGDFVRELAANGYGLYRTNIYYMDQVAATYDFNEGAMRRFHERIKDTLDPNGILSPGKQGIWPQSMRSAR